MKTTINKYFQIGWWFSDFKVASLLSNSEENQPQKRSKSLCLLQDKDYWKAVRIYNGNSPLDLLRIFNAEKKGISPFPAKVFWKIKKITFKQLQVEFYCIRYELYKELATQFKFVLPVVTQAESGVERFNTKRDIAVNYLDNSFEMIKKQS
ncbi:hypothetical protein, partial [Paraglaciecola hydrolytica]|uniref:hypothetical protein n=1 Tax=Paraglaciecola hydrolytica TaxID=1799789 RepID=UPI00138F19DB